MAKTRVSFAFVVLCRLASTVPVDPTRCRPRMAWPAAQRSARAKVQSVGKISRSGPQNNEHYGDSGKFDTRRGTLSRCRQWFCGITNLSQQHPPDKTLYIIHFGRRNADRGPSGHHKVGWRIGRALQALITSALERKEIAEELPSAFCYEGLNGEYCYSCSKRLALRAWPAAYRGWRACRGSEHRLRYGSH